MLLLVFTNGFLAVGAVVFCPYSQHVVIEMRLHLQTDVCVLWGCHGQKPSLCEVITGVGALPVVVEFLNHVMGGKRRRCRMHMQLLDGL